MLGRASPHRDRRCTAAANRWPGAPRDRVWTVNAGSPSRHPEQQGQGGDVAAAA